jgi:hypothetical protein
MKRLAALPLCALIAQTGAAFADPCVGVGFDQPVPGAVNVVTRRVDVPSPQFPGLWQEGVIDGFFYTLFANGEGTLKPSPRDNEWELTFVCDLEAASCSDAAQTIGGAPPAAQSVVDQLERCLLSIPQPPLPVGPAPSVAEPPTTEPPVTEPPVEVPPQVETPADDDTLSQTRAEPCGLAAIPAGAPVITMQRLLVAAGANPGPVDGFPGQRTTRALVEILGAGAANLSVDEANESLDKKLCAAAKAPVQDAP